MVNIFEVNETNKMIDQEHLDVRTITMGISLMDCIDSDPGRLNEKIRARITQAAGKLVETGEIIEREYGIPIVNKRISVRRRSASISSEATARWWRTASPARMIC